MAAINIVLNGEGCEIPSEISLDQLLELFSLPQQRIAVEVNDSVIRRDDWHGLTIADGDKIEIVHFVGGG